MCPRSLRKTVKSATTHPHGTRARYKAGCRCLLCRAANARYEAERAQARAAGDNNSLVAADAAREHLLRLSREGVGTDAVSAASDIATSVIWRIRSRLSVSIRRRTEEKLLAVTKDALSDSAVVSARPTWRQINALLAEGFTKAELARRLNYKTPCLQFGKKRILARTAARVDRLYRLLMKE